MGKLFWIAFVIVLYFWIMASHRDEHIVTRAKSISKNVSAWWQDNGVELPVQIMKERPKKRARRWD